MLVLSLFPGIDLLGRGFEAEGFCVVRGPDTLFGGDIRNFHPPRGRFDGVMGGSPCQDFSRARRSPPTGYGLEMLAEFARCVTAAAPEWWLLENVDRVPDVHIDGYVTQRLDLNARECGLKQSRHRHIQFGSRKGWVLTPQRLPAPEELERVALATEGRRANRHGWAEFCALQGLPPLELDDLTLSARYKAVGNGVPVPMARVLARAVWEASTRRKPVRVCACGCGRIISKTQTLAPLAACRQRVKRRRDRALLLQAGQITAAPGHGSDVPELSTVTPVA